MLDEDARQGNAAKREEGRLHLAKCLASARPACNIRVQALAFLLGCTFVRLQGAHARHRLTEMHHIHDSFGMPQELDPKHARAQVQVGVVRVDLDSTAVGIP